MRSGIMLATPYDLKRFTRWGGTAFIQPKLNGERCRAYIDENGKCRLLSSEANEIISVPHINKALESLKLKNIELDGELYLHGMDFDEIRSRVGRTVNLHEDYSCIEYHIFDIIDNKNQLARLGALYNLFIPFNPNLPIKRVNGWRVESKDDIMHAYEKFMEQGYEGFILRDIAATYERKRVTTMMKCKPKATDDYTILGYTEEVDKNGKPKGSLGSLTLAADVKPDLEGKLTTCTGIFNVGSGFTQEEREFLWKIKDKLIGRICTIEYQYLTDKRGVPRHPVFLKVQ